MYVDVEETIVKDVLLKTLPLSAMMFTVMGKQKSRVVYQADFADELQG
jgi:hypothetical protein